MYIAGSGTPYWYEWEVGLLECLKMMSNATVKSVILQSVDFQCLDDVVVNYNDGSMVNIQVKHTDVEGNFTYSTLTNNPSQMLEKWAKEWQTAKQKFNIKEIRIVTNRSWGWRGSGNKCSFKKFVIDVYPKLQKDFSYQGNTNSEAAACNWLKEKIKCLGGDAYDFVKILNFYQEEDLTGVDLKIRDSVSQIIGTNKKEAVDIATDGLLAKLNMWATSKRTRQEIYREDIYNALCVSPFNFPEYELPPEKPIFPSRVSFADSFLKRLQESDKKIFFLQGLPGSGKTNFVSYLAQLDNSIVDFRFYTYLPVNKDYPSFSDDEGYYTGDFLWRSLLTQLKKGFEKNNLLYELNFPLVYNYLSTTEMKAAVLKYLPEYAKLIGRTCYLFIDGLDHAARSQNARASFLSQLPLPNELNGDIKIVLVGQPINDKYPHQLINNGEIEYVNLPMLEESDIVMLLSHDKISISNMDSSSLAKSIIDVVGNNALNVLFALYEVKRLQMDHSFDSIIACLQERKLNCQIDRYYDWIVSSINDNCSLLLKIKIIFAFASQKIDAQDISTMCGEKLEDVVIVLNKLHPLIICDEDSDKYYTFHNDVRLFLKESMVSNSNYETLALSLYSKAIENENLGRYYYDILFGMALELKNKQLVFDLFSPEYIIKSIQYKVSVNRLVQQFYTLTQFMCNSKDLNFIDKASISASTIFQLINNIQYYQKENLFYDDRAGAIKTESEKYILSVEEKINDIVNDIYNLLQNNFQDRANAVFNEYLKTKTLSDYLSSSQDKTDREYYKRCGYICRFFAPSIFQSDEEVDSSLYVKFVEGWLDASSEFIGGEDIENTFSFKYYQAEPLNEFTTKICSEKRVGVDVFNKLCNIYLDEITTPISSLIDLCVYGIFHNINIERLQEAINLRQAEILTSDEYQFDADRILYYFKSYFCLFTKANLDHDIPSLYSDILNKNHIEEKRRGYVPAISLFNLSTIVFQAFYDGNKSSESQIKTIYETVYFVNQHGAGSSHDCNAYAVRKFLLNVLYYIHANEGKENISKVIKVCDGIKDIFLWDNARYVNELTELFYIADAKEIYLNIVEYWCGTQGILWGQPYEDVEYHGKDVVRMLNKFGLVFEAKKIEKIILFKLIGYVNHKDYSLSGLLDCYNQLPLSKEKLLIDGMKLLTISDKAYSIGDNRLAGEIEKTLFETAVKLGVKYIAALFELKNNPKEFYNWRDYFLNTYFKIIDYEDISDKELVALYNIVNAWVSEDIELKSDTRWGNGQLEFLQHFNYKIINKIKNEQLRDKLKSIGKFSVPVESNADKVDEKVNDCNKSIIDEICRNGYSQGIEQKIIASFSEGHSKQLELLLGVGELIDISHTHSFISNCVVEYIVKKRKYGFRGMGLNELIDKFCFYFSKDDWVKLFKSIADSISSTNMENFYDINDDIETLSLYYYKTTMPDKLKELCSKKLDTHWCWLTSCGLLDLKPYKVIVNDDVDSLEAFSKVQIGI